MSSLKDLRQRVAKARGNAARLTAYLPASVQLRLAQLIGYRHDYQGLDPHVRLLLAVRQLESDTSLIGKDAVRSRKHFRNEMASIVGKPTAVAGVRDFSIEGPASLLPVRHYQPEQGQGAPLLVFYHGGGFVVGDLDTHDEACRLLCKHGKMHVLSVDYRLAPEHPAPAAVEDCIAALKWAKANAASLGADPAKVAVAGDSAGGNLAAVVSQQTKDSADAPAAQLLIYPVVDLINEYESRQLYTQGLFLSDLDIEAANAAYVGLSELTLESPLVTPLLGDLNNLPPALVVTAAFDVLRDEGEAYAKQMQAVGGQVILERIEGQGHGFINITPINQAAKKATIKMARDLKALLEIL
ncbi:alpha/beta hydrolase [Alkanindiges sp. WGS2144]|uniref:alpha/beta hydrolase n=1 Tax=Alkanindiges sp. WGS2144 TaxID=3366808 RepID=UPI003751A365